jgi:hypothetical protein
MVWFLVLSIWYLVFRDYKKDSGQAGMTEKRKGNDRIHSGASGPANSQGMVIMRTLIIRKRYQSHNISLPLVLFGKGDKGQGLDGEWELKNLKAILKQIKVMNRYKSRG